MNIVPNGESQPKTGRAYCAVPRVCRECDQPFTFTKAHAPLAGCCSRDCHQARKVRTGKRKPPPPKRNDPLEAGVIYALCDPRTDAVRYIGKAQNLKERVAQYRAGKWHNPHIKNWMEQLASTALFPTVKVLEECLFGLGEREKWWIAHGREQGWDLTNITDGGDDAPRLPREQRVAMGKRLWADPDYVAKVTERHRAAIAPRVEAARRRREEAEGLKLCQRVAREAMSRLEAQEKEAARVVFVPLTHKAAAFVPLTRGLYAIIDADDWQRVSRYRWRVQDHKGKPRPKRSCKGDGAELLSRFVCDARGGHEVRSRDGNWIDCRRGNLIVRALPSAARLS